MKSKYVAAVLLLLVAGGATASCLPDPGSIICQDSQGEYHVAPHSENSVNDAYEPLKSASSHEISSHSSAPNGNLDTSIGGSDPKEYFRKYQ